MPEIFRTFFIISIILTALMTAGCQQEQDSSIPQGNVPISIDIDKEVNFLRSVVKEDPGNVNAYIRMGNIFMDAKRFPEAIDAYLKALKLDPGNVNVRADLGLCYRYAGRSNLALKQYKIVIQKDPLHLNAHINMGAVLAYDFNDYEAGAKMFEKYLKLAPGAPDTVKIQNEITRLRSLKK